MEPLVLLREATINRAEGLCSKAGGREAYSLESLWFLLQKKDLAMRAYYEECKQQGIDRVQIMDRREVLEYLQGKAKEIAQLSQEVAAQPASTPEKATKVPESSKEDIEKDFKLARLLEKEQRTRDSMLVMEGRSFKHVLDILNRCLKKQEEQRKVANELSEPKLDPRGDRYRVNNERFYREEIGNDFSLLGIDTSGTFKKKAPAHAQPTAAALATLASKQHDRPSNNSVAAQPNKKPRVSSKSKNPIIIVPGARDMSALVNLANLPTLLNQKSFRVAKDVLKEGKAPPMPQMKYTRNSSRTGQPVEYQLISNIRLIKEEDWDAVVAIICQGAEWQFKNFPAHLGRNPQEILQKIQGFYFHYAGVKLENPVKSWKLRFLTIDRRKRHEDAKVLIEFWDQIDKYMKKYKPYMRG